MNKPRIAYFINQYPKVSHSFIRREILALERQGYVVQRLALRGWDQPLADEQDRLERSRTRYVLRQGLLRLVAAVLRMALQQPLRFLDALVLALRLGWRGDRPWPWHLAYLAEACVIVPWMQAYGVRHVHAHFGTNSAEVAMLAHRLGGPPYSFTVHGPEEFDKPQALKLGDKIREAAFVVAVSSFGRSQLCRWAERADWRKLQVVHCGLEAEFHAIAAQPVPAAPRLVCVGRLCEQKGQLLLIEALYRLLNKGVELELVLAGDGEMRGEIEQLIAYYNLQHWVRITGWISSEQVREELLAARALVLPSFAEGLPVVIMEAMALRRPVLTTYVAGIPELVRDGVDGWLFPAGDVDALAAALEECLTTPLNVLDDMGAAAHQRVLQRHTIDAEAGRLAALLAAPADSRADAAPLRQGRYA